MLSQCAPSEVAASITPLPVKARKRSVFLIHCSPDPTDPYAVPPTNTPLTVDSSMAWFRSEGTTPGTFLCGISPPEEDDPDCHSDETLQCPDHSVFDDLIWPALYNRVPAFERLKVKSFWSGFYEYNTLDQVRGIMSYCLLGFIMNLIEFFFIIIEWYNWSTHKLFQSVAV
jgi:glycine/D-amino acid oxidase-like deaminating enzyme